MEKLRVAIPLILCGHPRSGTTMMTRLFNTHPELCVTFEFGSFRGLDTSATPHLEALRTDWHRRRIVGNGHGRWARRLASGVFLQRYRRAIRALPDATIRASTVAAVLADLFPHAKVVGDKFPDYVFDLDRLSAIEGVRIVVLYRDCRDVARSAMRMARTAWKHGPLANALDTPEKAAARWVRSIEVMERNQQRVLAIGYEDFVRDPAAVMERVGEWLVVDPSLFDLKSVHGASVGRHRKSLASGEIDRIVQIAGPTMERLGYA